MLKFTIKHIRSLSKNIENRCKGKVRKYTKVVIRCKAEQGENKNTNSMTFTHIHFIYDINDVFRAQKLFFQDFRGKIQFKTTIFFFSNNKLKRPNLASFGTGGGGWALLGTMVLNLN